jgi:hypothetical protein
LHWTIIMNPLLNYAAPEDSHAIFNRPGTMPLEAVQDHRQDRSLSAQDPWAEQSPLYRDQKPREHSGASESGLGRVGGKDG